MAATFDAPEIQENDPDYLAIAVQLQAQFLLMRRQMSQILRNLAHVNFVAELTVIDTLWATFVREKVLPTTETRYAETVDSVHDDMEHAIEVATGVAVVLALADRRISQATYSQLQVILESYSTRLHTNFYSLLVDEMLTVEELSGAVAAEFDKQHETALNLIHNVLQITADQAATAQLDASGLTGKKEWITREDNRVRPAHVEVNHARVFVDDFFDVDGYLMRGPRDPSAPLSLTINCRCHLRYHLDEQDRKSY